MLLTQENIEKDGFKRKTLLRWQKGNWYYLRCKGCNRFSDKRKLDEHRNVYNCPYCELHIEFQTKNKKFGLKDGIKDE